MTNLLKSQGRVARVLVTGSRHYSDYGQVGKAISITVDDLTKEGYKEIIFMQGGATGADEKTVEFINKTDNSIFKLTGTKIRHETYAPNFTKYGSPAAYHIRNQEMVDAAPIRALVFLEKGEANRGTISTVKRLKTAGVPYTAYGATELLDSVR